MLRITGGQWRGQLFATPSHIRATEQKVRQALFNILQARTPGARVLDGFAGSGALGLEALSRGASFAAFLESHPACVRALRANLSRIDSARSLLVPGDLFHTLPTLSRRHAPFDVILVDPPYEADLEKKVLNEVTRCGILAPAGLLCVEHASRSEPPKSAGSLRLTKQHRYGGTVLSFYEREDHASDLPGDV
ncbi:MAG: 16S rRNA (guanine(966)-N(2))-methyltransferase RsmD [Candidatus Omnitrophica bacterium]|nr:16S rRNA (guanine(966)-N(2))-methyltransferase RsmD [Candidatus Omnitrophota bacterium]